MEYVTFEALIDNYHLWKNSERDASKLEPDQLLYSYILEAEFLIGVVYYFRTCFIQADPGSLPFAASDTNFLKFLTAEELLVLCESFSQQKIKECEELIQLASDESN